MYTMSSTPTKDLSILDVKLCPTITCAMVPGQYFTEHLSVCEPLRVTECKQESGYNLTTFPNTVGQLSNKEARDAFGIIKAFIRFSTCYQHFKLLACHTLFPQCDNGSVVYPCYEMCMDAVEGCDKVLKVVNQPLVCAGLSSLHDSDECFYEPVRCPSLDPPRFGDVVMTGNVLFNVTLYSCNEGYDLQGEATRYCTHSGLWNGTPPTCKLLNNATINIEDYTSKHLLAVVLSVTVPVMLIIIITILLCIFYRKSCMLILLHGSKRNGNCSEKKKLFITYSSQDMDEITSHFIPKLKQHLLSWEVLTYQNDFLPGDSLIESIHKGVWESQAMLVLLTDNYVASHMCRYEFTEAETRTVTDKTFKLIVIVLRNGKSDIEHWINNLPESLETYAKSRVHLYFGEPLFWNKLKRALAS